MVSYPLIRKAGVASLLMPLLLIFHSSADCQPDKAALTPRDAVNLALENNLEIKKAKEYINAVGGRIISGVSLPNPEIGVSFEYIPANHSVANFSERTLSISQGMEFPTTYRLRGIKLYKEEEIALQKLRIAERGVSSAVKIGYYKVLAKKELLNLAKQNVKITEDFYKKAEIRQNIGEGTNLEKLTAKVQFAEAKNSLEAAKNELLAAEAEFNYTLGFGREDFTTKYELTAKLTFTKLQIVHDELYKSIEGNNPRLKNATLNYDIATVEKNLAWSSLLPDFTVSYFKQTRDGSGGFYGASAGISVPLWFMFDQRGRIEEASANEIIAGHELGLTFNETALQIKNSLAEYENNLRQVKLYTEEILPQTEEIYKTAIKSYDAGEISYLEYLQARQTLISSQGNYITAVYNYYQSVFRMEEISGKDLAEMEQ